MQKQIPGLDWTGGSIVNPTSQGDAPREGQDRAAAERREAPPAVALPCLLVTTQPELATGEGEDKAVQVNKLQGSHKRSAQAQAVKAWHWLAQRAAGWKWRKPL